MKQQQYSRCPQIILTPKVLCAYYLATNGHEFTLMPCGVFKPGWILTYATIGEN